MNLRQIEAFRATIRAGSVSGAALLMRLSQPSISRLIADLERSVGFALFSRNGRGLVPTVEGRRLHEAVDRVFAGLDHLGEMARIIRNLKSGEVALGVIPSLVQTLLPQVVGPFHATHRDVHIAVSVQNTPAIVDAVAMQRLDLGIVSATYTFEGVDVVHERGFPGVCLVPEGHSLFRGRGRIDLLRSGDAGFVAYDRPLVEQLGFVPEVVDRIMQDARISSHSAPAVAALARATGLLAIVDPFTARLATAMGGVRVRPLVQRATYTLALIKRDRARLSLPAQALSRAITAALGT